MIAQLASRRTESDVATIFDKGGGPAEARAKMATDEGIKRHIEIEESKGSENIEGFGGFRIHVFNMMELKEPNELTDSFSLHILQRPRLLQVAQILPTRRT